MNDDRNTEIDLVYNPIDAFLPPQTEDLQWEYKTELNELFGIQFYYVHIQLIKGLADYLYIEQENWVNNE